MAKAAIQTTKPVMTDPKGQTLLCLRTLTDTNPASLAAYEKLGGYAQLKRILTEKIKAVDIIKSGHFHHGDFWHAQIVSYRRNTLFRQPATFSLHNSQG